MLANTKTSDSVALLVLLLLIHLASPNGQVRSQDVSLNRALVAKWELDVAGMTKFSHAYFGNSIFVASNDAIILAIEKFSGKQIWRTDVGGEVSGSLAADDNNVFVATRKSLTRDSDTTSDRREGSLRCLSASSGLTQWVMDYSPSLVGNLKLGKTHLFSYSANNILFAFNKTTGATVWSQRFNTKLLNSLVTQNDYLIIGSETNILYSLNQQTGKTVWKKTIGGTSKINSITSDARKIYVGTQDGRLSALELSTGAMLWQKKYSGSIKSIATVGNQVIVVTASNLIYCVESTRGRRVWKRELAGRVAGSPAITGAAILVATVTGEDCVALQISNGKIINTISVGADAGLILQPIIAEETVVLITEKGMIGYAPIGESPGRVQ